MPGTVGSVALVVHTGSGRGSLSGMHMWKDGAWNFFLWKKKGKQKIVLKGERLMFALLSHTWFGANEVV